jgi:predicted anti-sigma-YlaC factor YlaD
MDCAKSLELLSEYHANSLQEPEVVFVRTHLTGCVTCHEVYEELNMIVQATAILREADGIAYPDESVLWQRLNFSKKAIH